MTSSTCCSGCTPEMGQEKGQESGFEFAELIESLDLKATWHDKQQVHCFLAKPLG